MCYPGDVRSLCDVFEAALGSLVLCVCLGCVFTTMVSHVRPSCTHPLGAPVGRWRYEPVRQLAMARAQRYVAVRFS